MKSQSPISPRNHVFLGAGHERNERRTWAVIVLCTLTMLAEIIGGWHFGSVALIADGLHMSTHAGAMLIAASAYTYARRHARDPRFAWGTGKFGDLAGFTSAVALAMISLLIGWEAVQRLFEPVPIHFTEAISIAALGLCVNIASVLLLGHDHHGHDHGGHDHAQPAQAACGHDHGHDHGSHGHDQAQAHHDHAGHAHDHGHEHHEHAGHAHDHGHEHHDHSKHAHDLNFRAAYVHVLADAAVSVLVIVGLLLARAFGWTWTDPVAGLIGAVVIANWAYVLMRAAGATLLDMTADPQLVARIRALVESHGDALIDVHVWRLGPGHLSAELSVTTRDALRDTAFYRTHLLDMYAFSHLLVEVERKLGAAQTASA